MNVVLNTEEVHGVLTLVTSHVIDNAGLSPKAIETIRGWRRERDDGTHGLDEFTEALNVAIGNFIDERTTRMLRKAQSELNKRLRTVEGLQGAGKDSFTAAQMRTTLAQIRIAIREIQGNMRTTVVDEGKQTAERATEHTLQYIQQADQRFTGIARKRSIPAKATMASNFRRTSPRDIPRNRPLR